MDKKGRATATNGRRHQVSSRVGVPDVKDPMFTGDGYFPHGIGYRYFWLRVKCWMSAFPFLPESSTLLLHFTHRCPSFISFPFGLIYSIPFDSIPFDSIRFCSIRFYSIPCFSIPFYTIPNYSIYFHLVLCHSIHFHMVPCYSMIFQRASSLKLTPFFGILLALFTSAPVCKHSTLKGGC